jgi:hypothetical protein
VLGVLFLGEVGGFATCGAAGTGCAFGAHGAPPFYSEMDQN